MVLDVASGLGETDRLLEREFGCKVHGVDLSSQLIRRASNLSDSGGSEYVRGDGESLPFKTGSFTAVLSECSMCLLPELSSGCEEAIRVLQRGGKLGLSDIVFRKPLPPELDEILMAFLCLSNKIPPPRYASIIEEAGFSAIKVTDASGSLRLMLEGIRKRLFLAEMMSGLGKLSIKPGLIERGKKLLSLADDALDGGSLGYFMLTAVKP